MSCTKENFRTIDDLAGRIYELEPLIFDMKVANGGDKNQTGFIAEDVAPIFPSLVAYNMYGEVQAIKYDCLHALIIKELQKHKKILDENKITIENGKALIHNLKIVAEYFLARIKKLKEKN